MFRKQQRNKTQHIPSLQVPCPLQMPMFSISRQSFSPIITRGFPSGYTPVPIANPSTTPLHFSRAAAMEGVAHV